jgi:hypothetical protein
VRDFFVQSTHGIQHLNLHSAIRSVAHDSFPTPKPPVAWDFDKEGVESFSDNRHEANTGTVCQDPDFFPPMSTSQHLITQQELNDPVRDLSLSQIQLEMLASQLQGCNCFRMILNSLHFLDEGVILKSFSCPRKMLCIAMMQMACLEHWVMFIIQKGGCFFLD